MRLPGPLSKTSRTFVSSWLLASGSWEGPEDAALLVGGGASKHSHSCPGQLFSD